MSAVVDLGAVAAGLLADTALKGTLVLAAGGLVARLLGGASASSRHAVWASSLAALPVLAAVSLWTRGEALGLSLSSSWLVIWALGVGVSLSPLLRGLVVLLRARRGGEVRGDVVWTDAIDVPLTFARTVLMPRAARGWSDEELHAAHLHEQAHVSRGDWWVHVGVWLVAAVFWFHPGVWWARSRLSLEAERAADDRVLSAGVRPSVYARQLLGLSRGPLAALSMGRSATSTRVRAVLCLEQRRRSRRWPVLLFSLVFGLAAGPALAGWSLWSPAPPVLHCDVGPELLP